MPAVAAVLMCWLKLGQSIKGHLERDHHYKLDRVIRNREEAVDLRQRWSAVAAGVGDARRGRERRPRERRLVRHGLAVQPVRGAKQDGDVAPPFICFLLCRY